MQSTPTRLFDLLEFAKSNMDRPDALSDKATGSWRSYSTSECIKTIENFSLGLYSLGIRKGDKIGMVSENRTEWNFIDQGIISIGGVTVAVYTTQTVEQVDYILNDSSSKLFFVSTQDLFDRLNPIFRNVKSLQKVYTINEVSGADNWKEVLKAGEELRKQQPELIKELKSQVSGSDLATLIYTSGTTGMPKGVMLSHNNIVSNVLSCSSVIDLENGKDKSLSFLPLCHSFERMVSYWFMYKGVGIYYAESLEKIADNLKEVHPTIFTTVPRLLEKVYDKIVGKGADLHGVKKQLFFWALNLGKRYEIGKDLGLAYNIQLNLANKLIFSKWREALGGNVRFVVSGGAALSGKLANVFTAAQITILQGYGLTETSPVISVARPDKNRAGTVGPVIDGVEVKIAEDGEILTRGPNLMLGYYNKQKETDEVIIDGWFHTGDIGKLEDGFLSITDRKKEIFKTSGGKYVAPQPIENDLKSSRFIEMAQVIGDGHKYPAALIVPSFINLKAHFEKSGKKFSSNEELIHDAEVVSILQEEVDKVNSKLGQTEKIKKFELLTKDWTIDGGELTPKMSIKRKFILEKYAEKVYAIYADEGSFS